MPSLIAVVLTAHSLLLDELYPNLQYTNRRPGRVSRTLFGGLVLPPKDAQEKLQYKVRTTYYFAFLLDSRTQEILIPLQLNSIPQKCSQNADINVR